LFDTIDNEFVAKHLYQVLNTVKNERFSPLAATFAAPMYIEEINILIKKELIHTEIDDFAEWFK
jgi:hypothetical protein